MKKFRFLLIVAVVLVAALALCLTASAADSVTIDTYDQVYVGEYTSPDEIDSSTGTYYTGEAYIVFGKVTGTEQAGLVVERYAVDDSSYANVLETKYYHARDGRISSKGEFGIALFNLTDGYYKAYMIAGDYKNPSATGDVVTFSKGVATYTATFWVLDGTGTTYVSEVTAGGSVVPPEIEREGYQLAGWHKSASGTDFGQTYEKNPGYFKNITSDVTYTARWIWVGEDGDYQAPEVFNLSMSGYSKFSVKYTGTSDKITIPSGGVGIMSFDVLEDATGEDMGIGFTNTSSDFWWLACNADTNAMVFTPIYFNNAWSEYNGVGSATESTGTRMTPENILKKGNSVKLVYKPYESDTNLGWYRAYVKTAGSSDYVLYAGWEGLSSAQATVNNMPCIFVGNANRGIGSINVPLANMQVGLDADGDYTTTSDFTDKGIGFAGMSYDNTDNRYVIIDKNYCPANQLAYNINAKPIDVTSVMSFMTNEGDLLSPSAMNTTDGSKMIWQYTIDETNIDSAPAAIQFGFGMNRYQELAANWWSGTNGIFMSLGGLDTKTVKLYGSGNTTSAVTEYTSVANATMRQILARGNTVKVEISWDTVSDDDAHNDGYIRIYYKSAGASEFTLGAAMENIDYFPMLYTPAPGGGYPFFGAYSWTSSRGSSYEYNATISNVTLVTVDANGNVTGEREHMHEGVSSKGYTTTFPVVTKYNPKLTHTVTIVDGDGNILDVQKVKEGYKPEVDVKKLEKAGYDFVGFAETIPYCISEDITLTAQYDASDYFLVQQSTSEQTSQQALWIGDAAINPKKASVQLGSYFEMDYTVLDSNVDECPTDGANASYVPKFGFAFTSGAKMNTTYSSQYGYGFTLGWLDGTIEKNGGASTSYNADIVWTDYDVPMKTLLSKGTSVKFITAFDTVDDGINEGYSEVWYKTASMEDYELAATMTNVGYVAMANRTTAYPMLLNGATNENSSYRLEMDATISMATYDAQGNVIQSLGANTGSAFSAVPNKVTKYDPTVKYTVNFVGPNGEILGSQQVIDGHDAVAPSDFVFDSIQGYEWLGFGDVSFTEVKSDLTITSNWANTQRWTVKQFPVVNGTGNENSIIMSNTAINRDNLNGDEGERFEMNFTVVNSNVDEYVAGSINQRFGFGFSHTNSAKHNWSGTHCYVLTTTWDGKTVDTAGGGHGEHDNSGFSKATNKTTINNEIGWATILSAGTQVKGVVVYDRTDDGIDTGKIEIYYKTSNMNDFALAAGLYNISYSVAMTSNASLVNHYPLFVGNTNPNWALEMDIEDLSFATYDKNDNRITYNTTPITDSSDNGVGNTVETYVPTYTVNFVGPNGEVLSTQKVKEGSDAVLPSALDMNVIPGYFWGGVDMDITGITGDTDITSTWTETEKYNVSQADGAGINSGGFAGLITSNATLKRADMNADEGEKFVMTYYVESSNVNTFTTNPTMNFGFSNWAGMNRWWSATHAWGAKVDWNNGTIAWNGGNCGTDESGYVAESAGVGAKVLFSEGTFVRVEIGLDLTADDVDTGYIAIYYKDSNMEDFKLFAKLSDISQTLTHTSHATVGVNMYPIVYSDIADTRLLEMDITNLMWATYDADGNVTSSNTVPVSGSQGNNNAYVTNVKDLTPKTVTFIGPDGEVLATKTVYNGRSLTVDQSIFFVDAYSWAGYDGEYDFSAITEDMTVYSLWTEKAVYTVSFYAMDGTDTIEVMDIYEGDTAVPPAFTRPGYELTGWVVSKESNGSYDDNWRSTSGWGTSYTANPGYFGSVTENRKYAAIWKWVGEDGTAAAPALFKLSGDGYSYFTANSNSGLSSTGAVAVMQFDVKSDIVGNAYIGTTGVGSPYPYNYYSLTSWALYYESGSTLAHYYYGATGFENLTKSNSANVYSSANILKAGNSVQVVYSPYRSETAPGYLRAYIKAPGESTYTLFAGFEGMTEAQAPATTMPCIAAVNQEFSVALANVHIGIDTDGNYATLETEHGFSTFANGNTKSYDRYMDIDTVNLGVAEHTDSVDKALMLVANKGTENEGLAKVEWFGTVKQGDVVTFDVDNGTGLEVLVGDYTLTTSNYRSYKVEILNSSVVLYGWAGTEYVVVDSENATISTPVKFALQLRNSESAAKQVFIDNLVLPNSGVDDFNYAESKESEIKLDEFAPGKYILTTVGYSYAYIPQDDFVVSFYDVEGGETIATAYYGYGKKVDLPEGYALVDNDDLDKITKVEGDAFIALRDANTVLSLASSDRSESLYTDSTYAIAVDDSAVSGAHDYTEYFQVNGFNLGDKVKVTMDVNVASTSENQNGWNTSMFKNLAGERIDDALPVDTDTKLTYETRVVSTENGLAVALTANVDGVLNMTVKNVTVTDSKLTTKLLGGATLYMLPNDKDISNEQMESFVLVTASGKVIVMDGGTQKDYVNLRNFLHSITDHVDAWFISHYHEDHIGAISILLNQKDIYIDKLYYDFIDHETFWGQPVVDPSIEINEDFGFESYEEMYAKGLGSDAGNSGTLLGITLKAIYEDKYGTSTGIGSGWMYIMFYDEVNKNLALPVGHADRMIGEVIETKRGDVFNIDEIEVRVLNDVQIIDGNFGNNTTINYRFNTAGKDILFLGDSGWQVGNILLNDTELIFDDNGDGVADSSVSDNVLGCTLIQAAHHGQNGVSESFYNEIEGDIYIYCAPEDLFYQDAGTGYGSNTTQCLVEREWQRKMGVVSKTYWMDGLFI